MVSDVTFLIIRQLYHNAINIFLSYSGCINTNGKKSVQPETSVGQNEKFPKNYYSKFHNFRPLQKQKI